MLVPLWVRIVQLRFRLFFRGGLAGSGKPNQKWEIRRQFAAQLENLWLQEPLKGSAKFKDISYQPSDCYLGETRNGIEYFPIVSEKVFTVAELDILMLRPGDPGFITVGGADLDNRLKTLLDGLQPPNANDTYVPENFDRTQPVACLLQDDKLITRLNVETDRLLEDDAHKNEVVMVVQVLIRASSPRMCNTWAAS